MTATIVDCDEGGVSGDILAALLGSMIEAKTLVVAQLLIAQLEETAAAGEYALMLMLATTEVIGAIMDELDVGMPRRGIAPQTRLTVLYVPMALFR